jgi:hypothetical protein
MLHLLLSSFSYLLFVIGRMSIPTASHIRK